MMRRGNLMQQLRRIFHYDSSGKRQSGFYKAVKVLSTAELARRGCGEYLFMMAPEPAHAQAAATTQMWNGVTAGVTFQDMASASEHIMALAENPLSDKERKVCDEYMNDLHPQPELEGPGDRPDGAAVLRSRIQIAKLKQMMLQHSSGRTERVSVAVREAKYAHFDERGAFMQNLVETVTKANGVRLASFEAEEFQVTPDRGFWKMTYAFERQ